MSFSQGITRNNCREPRGAENRREPRTAGSRDARAAEMRANRDAQTPAKSEGAGQSTEAGTAGPLVPVGHERQLSALGEAAGVG
jgi:hypothetical protein